MYNNIDVIQIVSLLYIQFDVSSFIFHFAQLTSSYMYCMLTCRLNKISLKTCYHCWKGSGCVYSFLIKGHVEKQETEISFTLLHKKAVFRVHVSFESFSPGYTPMWSFNLKWMDSMLLGNHSCIGNMLYSMVHRLTFAFPFPAFSCASNTCAIIYSV